ncbi:MAG: DUF6526 family protein [Gemmatimonadota bacterium]
MPEQNFENHGIVVTGYHRVTFLLIVIPLLWFGYRLGTDFAMDRLMLFVLALGMAFAAFYARAFALGVQDRVIRGEERARMARVLPPELAARIDDFTTDQLIGTRFASDEELPDLARRVLLGEFADRKAIKRAVKAWRADEERI